jgi:hypothetical protein
MRQGASEQNEEQGHDGLQERIHHRLVLTTSTMGSRFLSGKGKVKQVVKKAMLPLGLPFW